MNYLAHAYQPLNEPYFAASTALPDRMSVIDRQNRARRQDAEPITSDPTRWDAPHGNARHNRAFMHTPPFKRRAPVAPFRIFTPNSHTKLALCHVHDYN